MSFHRHSYSYTHWAPAVFTYGTGHWGVEMWRTWFSLALVSGWLAGWLDKISHRTEDRIMWTGLHTHTHTHREGWWLILPWGRRGWSCSCWRGSFWAWSWSINLDKASSRQERAGLQHSHSSKNRKPQPAGEQCPGVGACGKGMWGLRTGQTAGSRQA